MIAEEIETLYKLLRGNKAAAAVLEARSLVNEDKVSIGQQRLLDAKASYLESRSRYLKPNVADEVTGKGKEADSKRRTLERKREKSLEVIKAFDELMPKIERLVQRKKAKHAREEKANPVSESERSSSGQGSVAESGAAERVVADGPIATPEDLDAQWVDSLGKLATDARLDAINDRFQFRPVNSLDSVHYESLYASYQDQKCTVRRSSKNEENAKLIDLVDVLGQDQTLAIGVPEFISIGKARQLVLLTMRPVEEPAAEQEGQDQVASGESGLDLDQARNGSLDTSAFSQLLTSAHRCGLVPDADQIANVRDREFRKGQFDLALQAIESLHSRFSGAASGRTQRLTREDADIAAGRVRISPKELAAKRSRDRSQTQEIDRAGRRFQIVVEGLRQQIASQEAPLPSD